MKRITLTAALAGLLFGGCANPRSARLPEGVGDKPVGMEPIPSIHDTINRGSDPRVARATLKDPGNPNWSGLPLIPRRPETGLAPSVAATPGAGSAGAPGPAPAQTRWNDPPRELPPAVAMPDALPTPSPTVEDEAEASPLPPPAEEADPASPAMGLSPAAEPVADDPATLPSLPALPTPAPAPADAEGGDPLLGPNPQLMPDIEPAGPDQAGGKPKPAGAGPAPIEPAPLEPSAAPSTTSLRPAGRSDGSVRRVAAVAGPGLGGEGDDANLKEAGRAAAWVGDEVITLGELVTAVKDTVRKQGGEARDLPREQQNFVAKHVLAALIERSLMVQEAKHQLKGNDKQLSKINEVADRVWQEQELPPLLRQHHVDDERGLKKALEEQGRSYATLQQNFRQEFMAHIFMQQRLGDRTNVGLNEMLAYYNQHKNDKDNVRSPAIVWREILIEKARHASAAEARRKADDLLVRLRKGEDFAKLAAAESEGPARIRAAGGLMETAPGGYVVAAVNRAIETLPLKKTSDVVEGPESYHILIVESRRAGGPATFAELQDQIRRTVAAEKSEKQRQELVRKLRAKTAIRTIFDGSASDPSHIAR